MFRKVWAGPDKDAGHSLVGALGTPREGKGRVWILVRGDKEMPEVITSSRCACDEVGEGWFGRANFVLEDKSGCVWLCG